jgi:SAM-dependent methyltransferase
MFSQLLLRRFQSLAEPAENLNALQRTSLQQFEAKIEAQEFEFESVPCLCGSTHSQLLAQVDRYALSVKTHLCQDCGMMWTSPRMTERSLVKFYDEDYRSIYVGAPQAPDDFFAEQIDHGCRIRDYVVTEVTCTDQTIVFDVGCGAGGILMPFYQAGCRTFGCDLGSDYLQRGRAEGLCLEQGDVNVLVPQGKANLVVLSHVLEHFADPVKSLHDIANAIEDGGYLYIELPGVLQIYETYGDLLLFLQNAHLYHFTLKTLTQLLRSVGFELVKGDEQIKALFRKVTAPQLMPVTPVDPNHAKVILNYILSNEVKRPIKYWRDWTKAKVKRAFQKTHLLPT